MNNQKHGEFIKKEKNKKIKSIIPIIILLILITIIIIILSILKNNNSHIDSKSLEHKDYNCTLIKTYNVDNINESNDENYLYVTFKEYQAEGVYSIKLSKTISKDLKTGQNYEFTFNINKSYIFETPDIIFANAELNNITYSNKIGIEQKNEYNCK